MLVGSDFDEPSGALGDTTPPLGPIVIEARGLKVHFVEQRGLVNALVSTTPSRVTRAVDGVDIAIRAGEVLALAGESGCGKTTLGMTLVRLHKPTTGQILFRDKDLAPLGRRALKAVRRSAQIVFQDPYSSLNPRLSIEETVREPLVIHGIGNRAEQRRRVLEALTLVKLSPANEYLARFPHELSGGQRQRVAIARALVLRPSFIVADEPVSMLDVSVRAGILELLRGLAQSQNLAILYISHDLSTIGHIAHRMAVMYLGRIVEHGPTSTVVDTPRHPYTQALLAAVPVVDPDVRRERVELTGEVPSPTNAPAGCAFHTRCPSAMPVCSGIYPAFRSVGAQAVACHLYDDATGERSDAA